MSKLLILFALILAITSCQKEYMFDESTRTNSPDSSAGLLKRVVYTEDSIEFTIETYTYDTQNRLIKIREVYDSSSPLGNNFIYTTEFFYTGNNKMPYKDSAYSSDNNNDAESNYFSYDNQNRIITKIGKSPLAASRAFKQEYAYAPNLIIRKGSNEDIPGSGIFFPSENDSLFLDNNDRVIRIKYYDVANGFVYGENYEYDTRSNPYSAFNVSQYLINYYTYIYDVLHYRSPNNIVKIEAESIVTPYDNKTENFTYIYNSQNLPVKGQLQTIYPATGNIDSNNFTYEYY